MPLPDTALEQDEFRLVLVESKSHAMWAENRGEVLGLPRIAIPRWTRPAEQLQQAIKSSWDIRSIILMILPGEMGSTSCAVVEVLSAESRGSLATAGLDEIAEEEMTSAERVVVKGILAGDGGSHGPFSRVGWIAEAMDWVSAAVGRDVKFVGEIRQYNASATFALVRFATEEGPAYWLKATGAPNALEFQITKMLSELCPQFLPHRVAERTDWNAWLMEDAGQPADVWTLLALEQAVFSLAELQKETMGRTDDLLASGFFDRRVSTLRASLPDLVSYINEAMMRQASTKVPRLEEQRLQQLANLLDNACSRMESLGIPDTVVHNDLNSGNILFSGPHCVFTDWCEAGVGNPFLTFQLLCLLQSGNGEGWNRRLREAYKQCWLEHLTASQIEQAFALMPPLAILSYLCGRGTWLHTDRRNESHVESYARSLARHLDRAAQDPQLLEVLCR